MPGWHDAIRALYEAGELQEVGLIEEQHPDRARLFMQWKQMDWPILVDSLNLLETSAVPVTIAIDEYGIVRHKGLRLDQVDEFLNGFMKTKFDPPAHMPASEIPEHWPRAQRPEESATPAEWRAFADLIVRANDIERIDEAVAAYRRALEADPGDGWTDFRLGVALRRRYDSARRQEGDFQLAVDHWKVALDIDPNQYIWRRRIQQYGARLDKPYPFYDWVAQARQEIAARGEAPTPLAVEPGGAELAQPQKQFEAASLAEEPDPRGRIRRDEGRFIAIETTAVPARIRASEAARVHLVFRPQKQTRAHWNNEAEGLVVWVDEPDGCRVDSSYHSLPNPPEAVSLEERRVELELRCGGQAESGPRSVAGYSLYYVCEDVNGTCLYRRQDFVVPFEIR